MGTELNFTEAKKGYDKHQVEAYISEVTDQANRLLAERDAEIKSLREELDRTRISLEQVSAEYNDIKHQKESISAALINAEAKSAEILENAKKDAEAEKVRITAEADEKRNEIIERNRMIRDMKNEVAAIFDSMKQNMNYSFDGIIKTIDEDMARFSGELENAAAKYAVPGEAEAPEVTGAAPAPATEEQ